MNSDNFKKKQPKGKTVLNLDNNGNGTHWVGIKTKKNNILNYSDSFGIPPPFTLPNKLILFNPWEKQKPYEVNCGARSLNFLK